MTSTATDSAVDSVSGDGRPSVLSLAGKKPVEMDRRHHGALKHTAGSLGPALWDHRKQG